MLARGTREMVQAVMYFHEDLSVILNAHVKSCALWHWVCVCGGVFGGGVGGESWGLAGQPL